MAAKKRIKVTRDGKTLTVYPYSGGWRFGWRESESAPWRYVTRKTQAEAKSEAWDKLGELAAGGLIWSALDGETRRFLEEVHRLAKPEDFDVVLAFLKSRRRSAEVVASVQRFLDWKISSAGEETRHLANVRRVLDPMAEYFAGRVLVDISPADLAAWWGSRVDGLSPKTRNEVRGALVAFWNWAVWDGMLPKEVTAAEKLPRVALGLGERRILTPAEFLKLAGEVAPEFRAWIVLGAFCGLRPEEIAPLRKLGMSRKSKRGIRCEEIDFQWKVIRLPAEVSKVKAPRNVPLGEAALAWLEWAGIRTGMIGPVCLRNPTETGETARLGKAVFGDGWPQDALRHSYGSFRNAIIRNLPQVAEEMGSSETILRRHYHNPRTLEEGTEWFELRPEMIRFGPISDGSPSHSQESQRSAAG